MTCSGPGRQDAYQPGGHERSPETPVPSPGTAARCARDRKGFPMSSDFSKQALDCSLRMKLGVSRGEI